MTPVTPDPHPTLQVRPSPNHGSRLGAIVSLLVVHADAAPRLGQSLAWCLDPVSRVSYNELVGRTGVPYLLVPWGRAAWSNGISEHPGATYQTPAGPCTNRTSLSLAFSNKNDGVEPYTQEQYETGAWRAARMFEAHPALTFARIVTHAAIARPLGRKTDPGPLWDMEHFKALLADKLPVGRR